MMQDRVSSSHILEQTLKSIAPLPSQTGYLKDLAAIVSMHINRNLLIDGGHAPDELPAPSGLILAPTGQGKTFLLRKMAESMKINLITVDCGTLVGEGYKGVSLSQRLAGAMEEAKDQKTFERSILFFDEVDKLCRGGSHYSSGMTSLLQLFNGGSVALNKDDRESENIDISRFTILMGGAFVGLEAIIRHRISPSGKIGFHSANQQNKTDVQWMQEVTMDDLAKFGMMRELLGRLGMILTILPMGNEDYKQLLNAQTGSVRKKYDTYLYDLYGVRFEITDAGVEMLAEKCAASSAGARAVEPLVNQLLREAIARVEAEVNVCKVVLDADGTDCCIRYEYGERVPVRTEPEDQKGELPWHTVRAKNTRVLIRKLCRYYRNAGAEGKMQEQMEAFLGCTIPYLYYACSKDDFCLDSLKRLASASKRENGKSTFDNLVRRSFYISKEDFARYDAAYTSWLSRNVLSALTQIAEYLKRMHGTNQIRFEIMKKRKRE